VPRRIAVQIHGIDQNFKLGDIAEGEFLKRQGDKIIGGQAGGDSGAIEDHEAAVDPHPGYLTGVEGDAIYEAAGAAADAIAAHEALADPHPDYTTAAEAAAAAPVQSVAGKTGAVALAKADVGLGSVDNTADSGKPVSTAQQAALDLKAPLANPTFTGNITYNAGTIITDTTTGLKIGSGATQKLGFYGVTPVVRPSAFTQTYSTATKTHAAVTQLAAPAGGTGVAAGAWSTAANRDLAIASINAARNDIANLKQVVNAIIDDLQAQGLLQ
jgi:hypothetical protein